MRRWFPVSDVSKTNELIAEARLAACSECSEEGTSPPMRCDGDLIRRLADALEAATREPSEDDRERIAVILQLRHPDNMYSTCERDAEAILAARFSRVPE